MKKIYLKIFIFIFCVIKAQLAFAYNPEILNYLIYLNIDKNKIINVQEKVDAIFYSPMHYFYHKIPLNNYVIVQDKVRSEYKVKITKLHVNKKYKTYKDVNNYFHINIGDNKLFVNGIQEYLLNYKCKISSDAINKDELYFNLIGLNWESPIKTMRFIIKMPENVPITNIKFYDKYGEATKLEYKIKNNYIIGKYNSILYPNDTLSVKINFPMGYFNKSNIEIINPLVDSIFLILPILFLIFISVLQYNFDRYNKITKIKDFSPPKGYNAIDLGYIYYQGIDTNFIPALILHLANKNYLQIEEIDNVNVKDDFKITKVKNYDGNDPCQKLLFDQLFKNNPNFITSEDLRSISDELFNVTKKIIRITKNKFEKCLEKNYLYLQKFIVIIMIITWLCTCLYSGIKIGFGISILSLFILPIISYMMLHIGVTRFLQKRQKAEIALFLGLLVSVFTSGTVGSALLIDNKSIITVYIVSIFCIIAMDVLRFYILPWNKEGNTLYGRICGFKNYINNFDLAQLRRLSLKDKNYFYEIIPYVYVFNIHKNWFKRYKYIHCPQPEFYSGKLFSYKFLSNTLNSVFDKFSSFCAGFGK